MFCVSLRVFSTLISEGFSDGTPRTLAVVRAGFEGFNYDVVNQIHTGY
jgi:hypothetical protein